MGYFRDIWWHTKTIATGLKVTLRYLLKPEEVTTVQYPLEMDEIPERHRGIHYLETDVCILCYQCGRACPVDCIEIEGTRLATAKGATGVYEGAKGAFISKFTVDYSRCIFCNFCIEVCPVDCIHMGKEYDYSGYTRSEMVKNLLTDKIFSRPDNALLKQARTTIGDLEARDKAEKEAKKKAAAAAKPAAAPAAEKKPAEEKKPAAAEEKKPEKSEDKKPPEGQKS